MSSYFSGLQLDKITSTLSSAAYKTQRKLNETQEQFTQAINNIDEKYAILSLKTQKHKLQEALGTVKDISNLPPQYQHLEKKCDIFEKVCKRILMVTVTFEVEGYDYPPNITETLSDWWGSRKEGSFLKFTNASKVGKDKEDSSETSASTKAAPPSFAQAVGKAAGDSAKLVKGLLDEYDTISEATDEEEGDDDAEAILKMLNAWSEAQYNMDAAKQEMDQFMVKEFNKKLSELLNSEFKKAHALRKNVENSRLKFDTLRHEHAISKLSSSKEYADNKGNATEESRAAGAEAAEAAQDENDELQTLLEKAEDEFVSCTLEAVTFMTQLTNSAKMVTLVKLYHNFQLLYHKQCIQEIQQSLDTLNALALEDEE